MLLRALHLAGLSMVVAVAACLATIDENRIAGESSAGGQGGVGGQAGGGGEAGAGGQGGVAPLYANDWSSYFDALYLFESPPPLLGLDSSGNDRTLSEQPVGRQDLSDVVQGMGGFKLEPGSLLESYDDGFQVGATSAVTYGGWARVDVPVDSLNSNSLFGTRDFTDGGYSLTYVPADARFGCSAGTQHQVTAPGRWPTGTWAHVACVVTGTPESMRAFFDGVFQFDDMVWSGFSASTDRFTMPHNVDGVEGALDEVFYVARALDDKSIKRIYACGADGRGCVCDPDTPALYLDCGRAEKSDCTGLTPCDQPAP